MAWARHHLSLALLRRRGWTVRERLPGRRAILSGPDMTIELEPDGLVRVLSRQTDGRQTMIGYLVDPYSRTVEAVNYSGDFREIYQHIGADTFDLAVFDPETGDGAFVDDNGLLTDPSQQAFFLVDGYPHPLAGKALVLGVDHATGDSVDPQLSMLELKRRVIWLAYLPDREALIPAGRPAINDEELQT